MSGSDAEGMQLDKLGIKLDNVGNQLYEHGEVR